MTGTPRPFDLMGAFGLGMSRLDAELRAFSMGGSDCNIIAKAENDPKKKQNMWDLNRMIEVKLGGEPDNLTQNINVMLGIWTEPLNAYIYECVTGIKVLDRGLTVDHPDHYAYRASLDGSVCFPSGEAPVWEAKWTSMTNLETIVRTYYAQLQNNLDCAQRDAAVLSVLMGGKYDHIIVDRDDAYLSVLRERQQIVWEAVENQTGVLPAVLPPMPKPVMPPIFMRPDPVDLSTLPEANMIGSLASVFNETYEPAKAFANAKKEIVKLVPKDAAEFTGLGLYGKRNAKGALKLVPASLAQAADDEDDQS